MAFKVTRVAYQNFRSMEDFTLEPDPHLTILVGPNAAGKTNCIEGLQVLTTGSSFRHASPSELVRQGADRAGLRMHVESDKRMLEVGYDIFQTKKLLSINGKRRPMADGRGILPSILFYPDDLLVVKGGAAGRRELIDAFGVQLNKSYAQICSDYRRALVQRNALLKDAARTGQPLNAAMFDAWTESLVQAGSMLYLYRSALVGRLAPHIAAIYAELAGGEQVGVAYQSAYARGTADRAEVQAYLREGLDRARSDETRRCQTLVGPHLDDLELTIDGRSARSFGSQGQQRTLILAVKLAQVELVHQMQGQYPLFLLDDVMSELDEGRRTRLFELIQRGMQTIVTTTNLAYFRPEELGATKVVRLDGRAG